MAERSGLEIVGLILSPVTWAQNQVVSTWDNYIALIGVAEENALLRKDFAVLKKREALQAEEQQELIRLRKLLNIPALRETPGFAARVIASRFGPQAPLRTITINKGFTNGATVGTPVVSPEGVVGQVLRASPRAATVLLLSDPSFRVAVLSQKTRTPGIAVGAASSTLGMTMNYVAPNAKIEVGEVVVTAGVDSTFPKGIPIGVVSSVEQGQETLFLSVQIAPFSRLKDMEEVVLLRPADEGDALLPAFVGPPEPFYYELQPTESPTQ